MRCEGVHGRDRPEHICWQLSSNAGLLQTETTTEQQRSGEPQSIVPSDTSVLRGFANVQGRMK